jgi:signal peptidase complex subunit 1
VCSVQIVALITGYVQQDIYLTMWIGLAGTLLAMVVVVPPWPVFNQHPQPWLGSTSAFPPDGIVVGAAKGR